MASQPRLHTVLGASGGIGKALVRELATRGQRVRAVSRGARAEVPAGVEVFPADVATTAGATRACAGSSVVYQCAQPVDARWAQEFLPMTRAIIEGAAAAGARLVLAENLYVYGPVDRPLTEDLPYAATNPKGRVRAEMADLLVAANRAGTVRATMGRASDYYGPGGVNSAAGTTIFAAAVAGKTARWLGPLDVPHTLSYLPDIARGLATLGERPEADGRAWHLPAAEPVTGRHFLELVFSELGRPAKLGGTSRTQQRVLGLFIPALRELGETWYQHDQPFVMDASAFEQAFGPLPPTPHRQAVAHTLDWFQRSRSER